MDRSTRRYGAFQYEQLTGPFQPVTKLGWSNNPSFNHMEWGNRKILNRNSVWQWKYALCLLTLQPQINVTINLYRQNEQEDRPCGRQHKCKYSVWIFAQFLQNGQRKCGCFAAASFGATDTVPPCDITHITQLQFNSQITSVSSTNCMLTVLQRWSCIWWQKNTKSK